MCHTALFRNRETCKAAATMDEIFKSFCMFGQKDAAPLMDGSKFAKLCRDCKVLDKKVTSTDVDIIFSKVKAKTE